MKRSKIRRVRSRGFTLVEVLIVLAILVGLAALVVPRLLGTQKKADINLAKSQIGMLKGCLQRYHLDMKRFPASQEGFSALVMQPSGAMGGLPAAGSTMGFPGAADPMGMPDPMASTGTMGMSDTMGMPGTGTSATAWSGPYTESGEIPVDPWGNPYAYAYPPMNTRSDFPDIWSLGPDLQTGTADDICSWTVRAGGALGGSAGGEFDQYDQFDAQPVAPGPGADPFGNPGAVQPGLGGAPGGAVPPPGPAPGPVPGPAPGGF